MIEVRGWRLAGLSGLLALSLTLAAGTVHAAADDGAQDASPTAAVNTTPIKADDMGPLLTEYRQHLTTLSNPFFEGRAPGTDGNRLAASYIERHVKKLGFLPAFPTITKNAAGEVEKERVSLLEITKAEGKPEAAWDKIVTGRLDAWFGERVLLEQGLFGEKTKVKESLGGGSIVRFEQAYVGA